jgi:SAM-dependent methyltransferase
MGADAVRFQGHAVGGETSTRSSRPAASKGRRVSPRANGFMHEDEEDDEEDDKDGGDESDDSDYSSVSVDDLPPIYAFGHRYHGSGTILTPNDESEARRLEIQHQIFKMSLDGALTAAKLPTDQPLSVLDVGTGTGIWAVEMGEMYPLAHIMGIDVSAALLPTKVPRNVVFEVEDATQPWGRPRDSLDFVHMRNLVGGGIPNWRKLLEQAFHHLKPGGQIEFTEILTRWINLDDKPNNQLPHAGSPTTGPGAICREFELLFAQVAAKLEVDFDPMPKMPMLMSDVGFEKVVETSDLIPIRAWGNDEKMRRKGAICAELHDYGMWSS